MLFGVFTIKNIVSKLRKQKGVTQAELADAVFVTRQTIISIENGRYQASLELAYKISRYFDLTIEEVFDFSHVEVEKDEWQGKEKRI